MKNNLKQDDIYNVKIGTAVVFNPDMSRQAVKSQVLGIPGLTSGMGFEPGAVYTVEDRFVGLMNEKLSYDKQILVDQEVSSTPIAVLKLRGIEREVGIEWFTLPPNAKLKVLKQ